LVVPHHSVINYTHFGHGDRMRWLGFDLVVLFNHSFFMACMFFISGSFVRCSLARRRSENFLGWRAWRLGVPFFVSIFILMPVAYYPTFLRYHLPGTMDFNFLHFWWHMLTIGPWPSGSAWFLWVLLVLDAIASYGAILLMVYTHHSGLVDFNSPPLWWHTAYGLAFAMFSAAMTFTAPAVFLRFDRSSFWLLDAMQPSAYGITCCTSFLLSGCNTSFTIQPFRHSSSSRSCSPARFL
jgi:hypothetical protein